jgi:hypothetical protein
MPQQWRALEEGYLQRVLPWVQPRLDRRREGLRHPVDDFLFEYYRLRPRQLATWHPGWRYEVVDHPRLSGSQGYRRRTIGHGADPAAWTGLGPAIDAAADMLRATADRPGGYGCFGMHEWAMLYRTDRIRHEQVPLRVSPAQIADTVESVGLRCTHFDAYRFFTEAARPLQQPLSRQSQVQLEQPACLHAGMDLYRYAYQALPLISSDLVADCFEFARTARDIDMRASPYDLSEWGLHPIAVETASGRRDYAAMQRGLAERASVLRDRLLAELLAVGSWLAGADHANEARG